MGVRWIEYKGKNILYVDFKHKSIEEKLKILDEALVIGKRYSDDTMLLLVNSTDSFTNNEIINKEKDIMANMPFKTIAGLVGMSKAKMTIAKVLSKVLPRLRNTKFFDTEEEAKEWLVSQ